MCHDYLQLEKKRLAPPDYWHGGGQLQMLTEDGTFRNLYGTLGKKSGKMGVIDSVVSRMPHKESATYNRKGFLFIGRWVPNKGIRILLEAYRQVSPDPELWPLTLVGDGPLHNEVKKLFLKKKSKS